MSELEANRASQALSADMSPDIRTVDQQLRALLAPHSETPALDSQVLLSHVLARPKSWVMAHPESQLSPAEVHRFEDAARRLGAGEPLPYVLGTWEFFGLQFRITPAVLIPRPETELMLESALEWLQRHPRRRLAADVGTGSGCIAVALARNMPDVRLFAIDISRDSLLVARQNAELHGVSAQIAWVQGDLLAPTARCFDLICANLPYIPTSTLIGLQVAGWEPAPALDGGPDGLAVISRFIAQAAGRLKPGGLLLLEIEENQGRPVQVLAGRTFPDAGIQLYQDLGGRDRVLSVQTPE